MSRAPRAARAGFTLIETLVALVVFSVVAVVAERGIVSVRLGLERTRDTLAAEQVARSLVETDLDRLVRAPGEQSGETNGVGWTILAEPIDLPLPPAPPPTRTPTAQQTDAQALAGAAQGAANGQSPAQQQQPDIQWRLLKVTVSVQNGRARPLRVQTLRVVKDVSQ
ncbi:prepilin-type N-terminal cleavage/methylation domain-containing protein [Chelatococcus sambhunathii]|uniref:prepilin-type N-terminal cleavage/methylation domain-containing protein n=1 Tax=Chelatococcus sambhunathii TaxID=363953 RepID=UPI002852D7AF|nr:prepilin-type N-terminal cleavage/methylation domain-containing protein [Chelatococcus sambhunathii]